MSLIDDLSEHFRQFPGIGPRQAQRFVYHILSLDDMYVDKLADALKRLKHESSQCSWCGRYFLGKQDTQGRCNICADERRDRTRLLIIAKDTDLSALERTGIYNGLYFVLGGIIPIMEKEPEKRIRQNELHKLVKELSANHSLTEIIFALSLNPDGENTSDYIKDLLSGIAHENDIKLSKFGRGFSTGTEVEYSDDATLKSAFDNRI